MLNKKTILRTLVISLLTIWALPAAKTQNAASPFDLLPRIQALAPDSSITITTSSNPFDIVRVVSADRRSGVQTGFRVVRPAKPLTSKEKVAFTKRFLFINVLVMLIVLTLVFTVFRILIEKIFKAFQSDNLLNQLLREQSAGVTAAYLTLYIMFFLNAGLFLFLVCEHFNVKLAEGNLASLAICTSSLAGFFLLKHVMLWVVGRVFPVQKEVGAYNFTIVIFNIVIGFFLALAVLLTAYTPPSTTRYVIYCVIGVLLAIYLFRGIRGLFIATRFIAWHKFHFLLYLCAVEIAPLLILLKVLLSQKGATL